MTYDETRAEVRRVLEDPTLSFHQRRHHLALLAENTQEYPPLPDEVAEALNKRIICDLYEGVAPYRPRYILPDYQEAFRTGSKFLEMGPPTTLDEALDFLIIMYANVPSITGYPVYLGDLDVLLEPFVEGMTDEELDHRMRRFLRMTDRLVPDAFAHANLGPHDSRVGRSVLRVDRELQQVVPNLTLRVDPEITPDDLVLEAVNTVFVTAKPHFVNHPLMLRDLGVDYGVVSCYNSLPRGGGAHTLSRIDLRQAALLHTGDTEEFFSSTLPRVAEWLAQLMEARIHHIVDDVKWFDHDYLATEGFVSLDRFTAMYGIVGLAEAVNELLAREGKDLRYGQDEEANELGYRIVHWLHEFVEARPMPYCSGTGGRSLLHSQAGLDTDTGTTVGSRLPVGTEPGLYEHICAVAPNHDCFASGVSDIFHVEDTVIDNPTAMVDIIRGAFREGMRDFTFNVGSNDFIRITGYLVRKSDLVGFEEKGARHGSTTFGYGAEKNTGVTGRAIKRVLSHELGTRPTQ